MAVWQLNSNQLKVVKAEHIQSSYMPVVLELHVMISGEKPQFLFVIQGKSRVFLTCVCTGKHLPHEIPVLCSGEGC